MFKEIKLNKIALILVALALLAGCSDGGITTPTTNELAQPDFNYEIDTWGANSEVYEFTPRSNTNMTCVMFMLDNGQAMGLQCFPKPK